MIMATSRDLTVSFSFADMTKRTIKFGSLTNGVLNQIKTRVKAVKDDSDGSSYKYKQFLLSSGGATCTGITGATLTVTTTNRIFDAATYQP